LNKKKSNLKTLFTDIGGVLLTNGWDHHARKRATQHFHFDYDEMEKRHALCFDTLEIGKMTLNEYLDQVIFYKKQKFSRSQFIKFMQGQSQPFPEMMDLLKSIKARYGIKIAAVSNENRELTEYRIKKFKLDQFIDFFICSCYTHLRKPDVDIFKLAIDIAQTPLPHVAYLEDRPLFIEVAESLGIKGIHHTHFQTTKDKLDKLLISYGPHGP
jgi:putative hydrolase of the HAD superfamily